MSAEQSRHTSLADELHDLGRAIDVSGRDPDVVADQVLTRLTDNERNVRTRRRRWRPAFAAALVVLVVLALTPPVRAAVTEWFGVVITQGEPAGGTRGGPAGSATVPDADGGLSLPEAGDLVPFEPLVPDRLVDAYGHPDGVDVSPDRGVLSLSWTTTEDTVRLDQFNGDRIDGFTAAPTPRANGPAAVFWKRAAYEEITVDGLPAIWIESAHPLMPLDAEGDEDGESTRIAASTLIWEVDGVTLRLEGLDRTAAIEVAESSPGTE